MYTTGIFERKPHTVPDCASLRRSSCPLFASIVTPQANISSQHHNALCYRRLEPLARVDDGCDIRALCGDASVYHVSDGVTNHTLNILKSSPLTCGRQHNIIPPEKLVSEVTHIILAFMRSGIFNVDETPIEFPLFTNVSAVRPSFPPTTKVMVAIGGWGDSLGFEAAARDDESRRRWSKQVKAMVESTGADGVDVDWEYPG